jgi:lipoate-protein ligase A
MAGIHTAVPAPLQPAPPLFGRLWWCDDPVARTAVEQMALDEAWFRSAPGPVLRFYRWAGPALTFGYFGRHCDVAPMLAGRDVARRWTGGGIVEHGDDTTYALIIPSTEPASAIRSRAIYERVHEALAAALGTSPGQFDLAPGGASREPQARCFEGPVAGDLIEGRRKIAGAAQRRTHEGLLHQGSVARSMGSAGRADFARALGREPEPVVPGPDIEAAAMRLVRERYGRESWLLGR